MNLTAQDSYDRAGFRTNVGIVLLNQFGKVLVAKRRIPTTAHYWQFPQGGVHRGESLEQAMFRELREELGLERRHVRVLARTSDWMRYRIPKQFRRSKARIGQKQRWYLLQLRGLDARIHLDGSDEPEFSQWQWVSYWEPLSRVVRFKLRIYRNVLQEFHTTANAFTTGRS